MPRRHIASIDESAVLEQMGLCRKAVIDLGAAYGPRSGIYRESRHLTECIDCIAALLTGDRRYFHDKGHHGR